MTAPVHLVTSPDASQVTAATKAQQQVTELTDRLRRIERTIHAFVSSPRVKPAQRLALLGLLVGTRDNPDQWPHGPHGVQVLAEQRLLTNYRVLGTSNRQVISRLARQLAEAEQITAKKSRSR